MAAYGDPAVIAARSGVTFADLGFPDQAALDAFILELNGRASDYVEGVTNRDFAHHANDVVKLDGSDTTSMVLPGYPVISVASIKEAGRVLDAANWRLRDSEPGAQRAGIVDRRPPHDWASDWQRYEITYTWGYVSPPAAVAGVVENMVVRILQGAKVDRVAAGLSAKSMDGFSVTVDRVTMRDAVSAGDEAILAPFKRILAA